MIKKFAHLSPLFLLAVLAAGQSLPAAAQTSLAPPPSDEREGMAVPVVPHPDPQSLLESEDPQLEANKRLVHEMWRTLMNAGHAEAVERFLAEDYREHAQTLPGGREGFRQHIEDNITRQDRVPAAIEDPVVTLLAEGDHVVLARVTRYPEPDGSGGSYTSTRFDLFRIEDGRIAEHWDSLQIPRGLPAPQPAPLPVRGVSGAAQLPMLLSDNPQLAMNKRLVFDVWRHIPEGGREELAELYLDPIYIQHNPNAVTGRDGFQEYFSMRPDSSVESWLEDPLVAVVAEGDLVVQVLQEERTNPNSGASYQTPWFDMFRVKDGRLIEHWDTASKGELPAVMQGQQN